MISEKAPEDQKLGTAVKNAGVEGGKTSTASLRGGSAQTMPAAAMPRPGVMRPEIVRRAREYGTTPADDRSMGSYGDGKKLIVGRDIELNGKISSCEKLVVEGKVEANISECREIEISETGTFIGEAEIEVAEISGTFEGTINARDLLIIRSTGRITGNIRFGRLEVERGGQIEGDVKVLKSEL
ncbi:MAG: polymer-forming cytoskeletal protein [Proteobacteria bacterium]|nr:polymer-forming cytoskeletal protein [Pseudomonadota bacterium]MDA1323918.1 polymer-forming cytoskeletal protein [Pseudomonadota bacterium]